MAYGIWQAASTATEARSALAEGYCFFLQLVSRLVSALVRLVLLACACISAPHIPRSCLLHLASSISADSSLPEVKVEIGLVEYG